MSIERFFPNAPLKGQVYPADSLRPPPVVLPPFSCVELAVPSHTFETIAYPPAPHVDCLPPTLPSFPSLFGGLLEIIRHKCNNPTFMVPKLHVPESPADRADGAERLEIGKEAPQNAGANTTDCGALPPDTVQCGWPGCDHFDPPADHDKWLKHINTHFLGVKDLNLAESSKYSKCLWGGCGDVIRRRGWANHVRTHDQRFRIYCSMCSNRFYASMLSYTRHLNEFHRLRARRGASRGSVTYERMAVTKARRK